MLGEYGGKRKTVAVQLYRKTSRTSSRRQAVSQSSHSPASVECVRMSVSEEKDSVEGRLAIPSHDRLMDAEASAQP